MHANEKITVKSNRHTRPLYTWNDIPADIRVEWFGYVVDQHMENHGSCDFINDEYRFFNYRGDWYDYYEFEIAGHHLKALGWDGQQIQSFWNAIVVSYFDRDGHELDNEIIVGYAHW